MFGGCPESRFSSSLDVHDTRAIITKGQLSIRIDLAVCMTMSAERRVERRHCVRASEDDARTKYLMRSRRLGAVRSNSLFGGPSERGSFSRSGQTDTLPIPSSTLAAKAPLWNRDGPTVVETNLGIGARTS